VQDGFYYDFDIAEHFSPDDLGAILLLVYLVTESRPQGAVYDLPR
jgi:hypothetical protein